MLPRECSCAKEKCNLCNSTKLRSYMSIHGRLDKINLYKEYQVGVKINELELHVINTDESQKHNIKHKKRSEG